MGYGFGNFDLCKSKTTRKGVVAYIYKSFKKVDLCNSNAVGERTLANAEDFLVVMVSTESVCTAFL